MNKYELSIIIKPNLEEELRNNEIEEIKNIITKFNGNIEKIDDWGKRKLAYEINKISDGYYIFITFTSNNEAPIEIEKRIRIRENIIRYLIIRQDV